MSDCTHELHERETASADGMCPICLASERGALAERVEKLHSAADRARNCIKLLIARSPVRDVTETLAELDSALARPSTPPTDGAATD